LIKEPGISKTKPEFPSWEVAELVLTVVNSPKGKTGCVMMISFTNFVVSCFHLITKK